MRKADKCSNSLWRVEYLDDLVLLEIKKLAYDPDALKDKENTTQPQNDNERSAIADRIQSIDKQIKSLIDLYQLDGIPLDEIGERISKLRAEKVRLTETLENNDEHPKRLPISEAKRILKSALRTIEAGSEEEKKNLVTKLVRKIIVNHEEIDVIWSFT